MEHVFDFIIRFIKLRVGGFLLGNMNNKRRHLRRIGRMFRCVIRGFFRVRDLFTYLNNNTFHFLAQSRISLRLIVGRSVRLFGAQLDQQLVQMLSADAAGGSAGINGR